MLSTLSLPFTTNLPPELPAAPRGGAAGRTWRFQLRPSFAPFPHRLAMASLACAEQPHFVLSLAIEARA